MKRFFGLGSITLLQVFVAGLLLRLILMPFLFHPDIKTYSYQSSFLGKGVFNIYKYIPAERASLPLKEEFVYFPLTYFTWGTYMILLSGVFGSDFSNWISDASGTFLAENVTFKFLFLLKVPILFLDLLIGFLLLKTVAVNRRKLVGFYWLFNPFTLIILYGFSNVDIFPVLFSVIAILLAVKNRFILSALMLGIGAGFKAYPILLLPIVFFAAGVWWRRLAVLAVGLGVFLLVCGYFLRDQDFVSSTLSSGLTSRLFSSGISLGFGDVISLPVLLITVFLGYLVVAGKFKVERMSEYFLICLLILVSSIHYHVQWLLWFAPFLVVFAAENLRFLRLVVFLSLLAITIPLLSADRALNFGLISAVSTWFLTLTAFNGFVSKVVGPEMLIGFLHSVMSGVVLVLAMVIVRESDSKI